ncbi:MAG TPA: protein kinase [Solirubrobacterales bacterium]|jgi:serine/threonine protein kinase|nr:protein kinase [Solirubrobacterales bacterium]
MQQGRVLNTKDWVPDERELDRGANSVVYLARRGKDIAVLKVCSAWKPETERYKRFVAEVQTLEELSDEPGVMRVLDSEVPDPKKGQFPWYVMPEGVPLSKLRSDTPLDEIITGLASIAGTLRAMHDREYSHRDIKPSNLFAMEDGTYVVGDFGLVGVPEEIRQSLTREGGSLGPANFMAPEMLEYVPGTDACPADVYSLAKSIWALAAKRRFPLPGHQRSDARESLAALLGEDRAHDLDRLIQAATEHDPSRRPTMAETATALEAWVETHTGERNDEEEDELTAAIAGARARLSNHLSEAESAATDLEHAQGAFDQLTDAMSPNFIALSRVGGSNDTVSEDPMLDATLGHPFLEELGRPLIVWRNQVFVYTQLGDTHDGVRLAIACATALYEGQEMASAVGILVYEVPPTLGSDGFAWHDSFEAAVGTLTVSQETQRLAQRAREQMPAAITSFSDLAERL